MAQQMKTWLIAHTAPNGTNIAQASIGAKAAGTAEKRFRQQYPDRILTVIAAKDS